MCFDQRAIYPTDTNPQRHEFRTMSKTQKVADQSLMRSAEKLEPCGEFEVRRSVSYIAHTVACTAERKGPELHPVVVENMDMLPHSS